MHAAVTKQLIAARCNVDIQDNSGRTALQVAQLQGHAGIATLIKRKNHKGADRAMNGTLLQVSPEKATKKQQEDADRAMKELLEAEEKSTAACIQKKKKAKKRTEAKAESEKKTENVSAEEAAAAEIDDAEEKEERKREAAEWNKAEATPQVIQGFWLSQEQDDVMACAQEAGGAAAGATADVEAISWPASLEAEADVKQAPDIMSAAADTNEPKSMFMAHDDLQDTNVPTALQVAQLQRQEDADRAMKELLVVEERDAAAAAAAVSQKKKQAKAEAKSEKKKTANVNFAAAAVTAAFKDKVGGEEERKREAAERKEAGIVYYIQSLRNSALIP
jgi:hypothetical protein